MSCEGFDSIRPSQPKRCSDRSSEEGTARRAEGVLRLDRSTVWAETAVSSRFLHMALTRAFTKSLDKTTFLKFRDQLMTEV